MKVVTSTDEYTIYQRRDGRYAVVDADKKPVNGDAKITVLLQHELIKAAPPKAPEPEPAAEEEQEASAEDAGEEAAEEEAPAETADDGGEEEPKEE